MVTSSDKHHYGSIGSGGQSNFEVEDYSPYGSIPVHHSLKKKIGLASLAVLAFYTVSGGPFGIEDVVRASKGGYFALWGFLLMLVWSVPEALITAEMSRLLPESSGSVAWVDCAFGKFWAFQKGWLSLVSGISDNALYPILFLDCLIQLFSADDSSSLAAYSSGFGRWTFICIITIVLTYFNYRGLEVVGNVAIVICVLSLLPFVAFCILGFPKVDVSRWFTVPEGGLADVDWQLLLNTFFWNINYWESSSSFSGDVENPSVNYPRGMAIAVVLVFLSLFLPILVGTGIATSNDYSVWTDGYFVRLASETFGSWMGQWMMFASALTNVGMFEAEMSSDAWQVAGMAERGILPSVFATRNSYGAPTYGVLLSCMGVLGLGWFSFSQVVEMLNLLYCVGQLIEFTAYLWLRQQEYGEASLQALQSNSNISSDEEGKMLMNGENLVRNSPGSSPYYFSFPVMAVALSFPIGFIVVIFYFSSLSSFLVTIGVSLFGVGLYALLEKAKREEWCEFHNLEEEEMEKQAQEQMEQQIESAVETDELEFKESDHHYHTTTTHHQPTSDSYRSISSHDII